MEHKLYFNNITSIERVNSTDDKLTIEGFCAHYGRPNLNNEIVDADSFKRFFSMYNNGELKPDLNWQHTDTVIGDIDSVESLDGGLYITAHLNYGVKIVDEMIAPNILKGSLCKLSTEGYIYGGLDGIVEREDGYYVKDFLLTSVSVVRTPADPEAVFTVKNFVELNKKETPVIVKRRWYL